MTPGKRDVSPISQGLAVFDQRDRKTGAVPSERDGSKVENSGATKSALETLSGMTIDGVPVEELAVDDFDDAAADRWNDGACDACHHRPKASADPDYLKGYADGEDLRQVRVVSPARPEGYYHMPLGTFE